jgi:hypothetical protein
VNSFLLQLQPFINWCHVAHELDSAQHLLVVAFPTASLKTKCAAHVYGNGVFGDCFPPDVLKPNEPANISRVRALKKLLYSPLKQFWQAGGSSLPSLPMLPLDAKIDWKRPDKHLNYSKEAVLTALKKVSCPAFVIFRDHEGIGVFGSPEQKHIASLLEGHMTFVSTCLDLDRAPSPPRIRPSASKKRPIAALDADSAGGAPKRAKR